MYKYTWRHECVQSRKIFADHVKLVTGHSTAMYEFLIYLNVSLVYHTSWLSAWRHLTQNCHPSSPGISATKNKEKISTINMHFWAKISANKANVRKKLYNYDLKRHKRWIHSFEHVQFTFNSLEFQLNDKQTKFELAQVGKWILLSIIVEQILRANKSSSCNMLHGETRAH